MNETRNYYDKPASGESGTDPVRDYLNQIGEYPLLTAEQEVDLARRRERGITAAEMLETNHDLDQAERYDCELMAWDGAIAERQFVNANLRLVVSVAKKYTGRGVELLDRIQEGNIGLMRAVEGFDWRVGTKFSTYATWWIRQSIVRGIAETGRTVRMPAHVVDSLATIHTVEGNVYKETGAEATDEQIADRTRLSAVEVADLRQADRRFTLVSLDQPAKEDSATSIGDLVHDGLAPDVFDQIKISPLGKDYRTVCLESGLNDRQIAVIEERFGLVDGIPKSYRELGELFGVSGEGARKIEHSALRQLRNALLGTNP